MKSGWWLLLCRLSSGSRRKKDLIARSCYGFRMASKMVSRKRILVWCSRGCLTKQTKSTSLNGLDKVEPKVTMKNNDVLSDSWIGMRKACKWRRANFQHVVTKISREPSAFLTFRALIGFLERCNWLATRVHVFALFVHVFEKLINYWEN